MTEGVLWLEEDMLDVQVEVIDRNDEAMMYVDQSAEVDRIPSSYVGLRWYAMDEVEHYYA